MTSSRTSRLLADWGRLISRLRGKADSLAFAEYFDVLTDGSFSEMVSFNVTHLDSRSYPHEIDVESAFREQLRFGKERSIHFVFVTGRSGLIKKNATLVRKSCA